MSPEIAIRIGVASEILAVLCERESIERNFQVDLLIGSHAHQKARQVAKALRRGERVRDIGYPFSYRDATVRWGQELRLSPDEIDSLLNRIFQ